MAVEIGVADNHLDFIYKLREFLTGNRLVPNSDISFPIGSDAQLQNVRLSPTVVDEVITLTVTDTGAGVVSHPVTIVNGNFGSGDLTGWTPGAGAAVQQVSELGIDWVCYGAAVDESDLEQEVALPVSSETGIDAGVALFELAWDQASKAGFDVARVEVQFLTAGDADLGTHVSRMEAGYPLDLRGRTLNVPIPTTARKAVISVFMKRYNDDQDVADTDVDSYLTNFVANVVTDPVTFAVTGSVTGAIGDVKNNEDFNLNEISFHMDAGSFVLTVSDTITFTAVKADLVTQAVDESWSVSNVDQEWNGRQYFLGTGLAGTDLIHVGFMNDIDKNGDYYNYQLQGMLDFNPVENNQFFEQPGISPDVNLQLWDSSIPYWFIANGRRFIFAAKISTTYQTCYAGLILPYATPGQFPLPLFVGGTYNNTGLRWSSESGAHRAVFDPYNNTGQFRKLNGSWLGITNKTGSGPGSIFDSNVDPWNLNTTLRDNIDGTYMLKEATLRSDDSEGNVFGIMDGLFWVSGFGNASENIVTEGGDDYLIIQNVFRTGFNDYCAIRLT